MTCCICGAAFTPTNPKRPAKTCSRACTNTMVWRAGRAPGGPKPRERTIANCAWCGKPVKWAKRPGRQGMYCSRTCTGRAKTKGGIGIGSDGRWRVTLRNGSKQLLARCLMEASLGRDLRHDEHVHHINGVKDDDRLENLVVLSAHEHHQIHVRRGDYGRRPFKLTPEQIEEITSSTILARILAERFSVSEALIYYHRRKARSAA